VKGSSLDRSMEEGIALCSLINVNNRMLMLNCLRGWIKEKCDKSENGTTDRFESKSTIRLIQVAGDVVPCVRSCTTSFRGIFRFPDSDWPAGPSSVADSGAKCTRGQ